MTTCPQCGHEFKSPPRINVHKGAPFFVNTAHGLATDTMSLGPISVFKGATVRDAVQKANAAEGYYACVNSTRKHVPGFINGYIGLTLAKADPVAVTGRRKAGKYIDLFAGESLTRVNAKYHAAMHAVSDAVLIDRNPLAPVIYLKDDTVVGLVMPVRRDGATPKPYIDEGVGEDVS